MNQVPQDNLLKPAPVEEITQAIANTLARDATIREAGLTIQNAEPLNRDINLTPWLGIYPGKVQMNPQTIGGSKPWRLQLEVLLYLQDSSHKSPQEASNRLHRAQNLLLNALYLNPRLDGTLLVLEGIEILPFQRDIKTDTWLFTNEISLQTVPA